MAAAAAHIIEYCASRDSRMGQSKFTKDGCTVTRLTIDHDLTTVDGFAAAEEAVYADPGALLWGSLPCTAGCPWNHINEKRPSGRRAVKRHKAIFASCSRTISL